MSGKPKAHIISISGSPGSGKSWLGELIKKTLAKLPGLKKSGLRIAVIDTDDFETEQFKANSGTMKKFLEQMDQCSFNSVLNCKFDSAFMELLEANDVVIVTGYWLLNSDDEKRFGTPDKYVVKETYEKIYRQRMLRELDIIKSKYDRFKKMIQSGDVRFIYDEMRLIDKLRIGFPSQFSQVRDDCIKYYKTADERGYIVHDKKTIMSKVFKTIGKFMKQ